MHGSAYSYCRVVERAWAGGSQAWTCCWIQPHWTNTCHSLYDIDTLKDDQTMHRFVTTFWPVIHCHCVKQTQYPPTTFDQRRDGWTIWYVPVVSCMPTPEEGLALVTSPSVIKHLYTGEVGRTHTIHRCIRYWVHSHIFFTSKCVWVCESAMMLM